MDRNAYRFLVACLYGFLVAALVVTLPGGATAQFNVASISPADGSTNVPTVTDIVIQFDAPLDESIRFDDDTFPVSLLLFPDSLFDELELTNFTLSADGMTLTFPGVRLEADARYVIAVLGAVSTTGEPLERPAVSIFTTGSSLPTGTVSGKVIYPEGDPRGTFVGLFSPDLFGEDGVFAATVVTDPGGNYTINFVPGGTYLPVASKDSNGDGVIDPTEGDVLAIYDPNEDFIADTLVVPEGATVTGVDLVLRDPDPVTAREPFPTVDALAKQQFPDAGLVDVIGPTLAPDGTSMFWAYGYYSPSGEQSIQAVAAEGLFFGIIRFGPYLIPTTLLFDFDEQPPDTTFLPEEWIDSDQAADTANVYGGAEFLAEHPDAEIAAVLANVDVEMLGGAVLAKARPRPRLPFPAPNRPLFTVQPRSTGQRTVMGAQELRALWIFLYFAEGEFLSVAVDALTGEFVPIGGPGLDFATAQAVRDVALQAAMAWASDAALVQVSTAAPDLTPDGRSATWAFTYYSSSLDSALVFFLSSGMVVSQGPPSEQPPSTQPLPDGWLDSNVATAVAEANSGNFRSTHPDAVVQATLSRGLLADDPDRAVWRFTYNSFTDGATLVVDVDAISGNLITSVKERARTAGVPSTFALAQNYPNPFNPETTIEFQLPVRATVRLVVTNVLGQTLAVLVEGDLPAGVHRAVWDGRDFNGAPLPSGVYFYRIEAGDFSAVRKAILMR